MPALVAHRGLILSDSIDDYPEGIILPVDKPYRWTSADVIRKLKYQAIRHFHKKNLKVGHAGTLDPLATGVLLVCIGKATKLAEELQASPKQYLAGVTFGATPVSAGGLCISPSKIALLAQNRGQKPMIRLYCTRIS